MIAQNLLLRLMCDDNNLAPLRNEQIVFFKSKNQIMFVFYIISITYKIFSKFIATLVFWDIDIALRFSPTNTNVDQPLYNSCVFVLIRGKNKQGKKYVPPIYMIFNTIFI